jgi:fructokinase
MYGGIEAGGTKWVCAVGTGAGEVVAEERFPTTTPAETIGRAVAFFPPHNLARESPFGGVCPFHGHCLEGLASGPAIEARWGVRAETLPEDHPAWELEAHYLALGLVNIICVLSPERIIMGGGVMHQRQVFTHLHAEVRRRLNDYLRLPQITERIEEYIVAPGLQDQAGVKGAMALAEMAAEAAR